MPIISWQVLLIFFCSSSLFYTVLTASLPLILSLCVHCSRWLSGTIARFIVPSFRWNGIHATRVKLVCRLRRWTSIECIGSQTRRRKNPDALTQRAHPVTECLIREGRSRKYAEIMRYPVGSNENMVYQLLTQHCSTSTDAELLTANNMPRNVAKNTKIIAIDVNTKQCPTLSLGEEKTAIKMATTILKTHWCMCALRFANGTVWYRRVQHPPNDQQNEHTLFRRCILRRLNVCVYYYLASIRCVARRPLHFQINGDRAMTIARTHTMKLPPTCVFNNIE